MPRLATLAGLAAVYALLGTGCFPFAIPPGVVSPVWPPAGLAFAALWLGGVSLWPGILLGSWLMNGWALRALGPSAALIGLGIGVGSAAQAFVGVRLLRLWQGERFLDTSPGVLRFFLCAAAACVIASLSGNAVLSAAGAAGWSDFAFRAWVWWIGDFAGLVIFAPLIIAALDRESVQARPLESAAVPLLCALVLIGVFRADPASPASRLSFLLFPAVALAGFRLGTLGVSALCAASCAAAVALTAAGHGAFARLEAPVGLIVLQLFFGALAVCGLSIAAAARELRRAQSEREQLSREATENLLSDMRERDRMRREFLANISHDLRTPLSSIVGYAETLLQGALDDPKVRREFVETIHRNGTWLEKLVRDLLELSALESGRAPFQPQPLHLGSAVDVAGLCVIGDAAKLGVEIEAGQGLDRWVFADPAHLRRMLQNALDNGVKFNRRGGRVTISASATTKSAVTIAIRDTGVGIAAEDLPRLFQRFERATSAVDRGVAGSGLGLMVIKQLAETNGGTVTIDSALDRGTTLYITLPSAPAPEPSGAML